MRPCSLHAVTSWQLFPALSSAGGSFPGGHSSRRRPTPLSLLAAASGPVRSTSVPAASEGWLDEVVWLNNLFTGKDTEDTKPRCQCAPNLSYRRGVWNMKILRHYNHVFKIILQQKVTFLILKTFGENNYRDFFLSRIFDNENSNQI